MILPKWAVRFSRVLFYIPGLRVSKSIPVTSKDIESMVERIFLERKTQWEFSNPSVPFPGVTDKELETELERRLFPK